MLDNYKEQKMFGMPQPKPLGVKALWMLWIFLSKPDQTKKVCMVCGGSPQQGAITLAYTYANSLDPASERLL